MSSLVLVEKAYIDKQFRLIKFVPTLPCPLITYEYWHILIAVLLAINLFNIFLIYTLMINEYN